MVDVNINEHVSNGRVTLICQYLEIIRLLSKNMNISVFAFVQLVILSSTYKKNK